LSSGIHITLGPAIILYKSANEGKGPFHTLATFTQTKPTEHAEGYGLFAGGRGLDGPGQAYVYFLVRQDGSYLIKRRDGEKTSEITKGWVTEAAVKNSKLVYTADAKSMDLDGNVGIRVNHNLDVHVEGFDVHR